MDDGYEHAPDGTRVPRCFTEKTTMAERRRERLAREAAEPPAPFPPPGSFVVRKPQPEGAGEPDVVKERWEWDGWPADRKRQPKQPAEPVVIPKSPPRWPMRRG